VAASFAKEWRAAAIPSPARQNKKGTAGCERRSDPFRDPPKVGTPELGNSASHACNIGLMDRFGCAMNHTLAAIPLNCAFL
jgi:hypothetical protein